VVVGRGAAGLSVGSDSARAAVPGPLAGRPRFSRPDTRVQEAGAGGGVPRAVGTAGGGPGVGTRRAARQTPRAVAGAARGATVSGNGDTDVKTGPVSADTRSWITAEETHVDGTFAGTSSDGPRALDTTVGKPDAGAQSAARPAPGTAAGAARGTPGSENSDKDVVPDRQCGNGLGTTQLFPAATVPRNTEHQLEAAPEDAPEESLVQFLFQ